MEVREVLPRNILNAPPDPLAIHDALGCFHECIVGYGLVSFKRNLRILAVVSLGLIRVYGGAGGPCQNGSPNPLWGQDLRLPYHIPVDRIVFSLASDLF